MIKTIRYFILFLNFDLAKGGALAPLAPPLVAPLHTEHNGSYEKRSQEELRFGNIMIFVEN